MSDKTKEERLKEEEQIIIQKMIMGEIMPNLVQSYKIIKNCIDLGISKGIYNSADTALLVRSFDTLRNHINSQIDSQDDNKDNKDTKDESVKNVMVDEAPSIDLKEDFSEKQPPRRKRG